MTLIKTFGIQNAAFSLVVERFVENRILVRIFRIWTDIKDIVVLAGENFGIYFLVDRFF